MAIAYYDSNGNAYDPTTGGQPGTYTYDPDMGAIFTPVTNPVAGQQYFAGNGQNTTTYNAYDDTKYSSPQLARLDNLGGQNGQTSAGLAQVIQQLGLDPTAVQQGLSAWSAQNPSNNINWLGSPTAYLQAAAEGNPSLAPTINPFVQANQANFNTGQAATAAATQAQHSPQSMHGDDYEDIAMGIASILGMGAVGGAFAGAGAAGDGLAAGATGAFDTGGATGAGLLGEGGGTAGGLTATGAAGGLEGSGLEQAIAAAQGMAAPGAAGEGLTAGATGAFDTGGATGSGLLNGAADDGLAGTAPGVLGNGSNAYESVINGLSNPSGASAATNPFEAQVGSSLGGQGATTATGPLANGIGGQLANGGLGSTVSTLANGGSIGGTTASGANGLASAAQSYLTNPTNYLSTIGNFLNQQNLGSSLGNIANTAGSMNNQANNPEAQAAYGTFMNYVNNPSAYINNVGAPITNAIVQGLPPSIAKSGNLSGSLAAAITAGNSALSQNYNGFLSTLGSQTGLEQSAGNAGGVYGNLAGQGAVANASAYSGLGSLIAGLGKNLTSGSGSTTSSTTNPFGTKYS